MPEDQKRLYTADSTNIKGLNQLAYKTLFKQVERQKDFMLEEMGDAKPILESAIRSLSYTPGSFYYSPKNKDYLYTGFRGFYRYKPAVMNSLTRWMDANKLSEQYQGTYTDEQRKEAAKYIMPIEGELLDMQCPVAEGIWVKGKFIENKDDTSLQSETASGNAPSKETHSMSKQQILYKTKTGESLSYIAQKFDVSVEQLKEWNGLTDDYIIVGTKLIIITNK